MASGGIEATTEDRRDPGGARAAVGRADAGRSQPATLGAAILARRLDLGLTQEELARRIVEAGDPAFRQSDVSRLEKGRVGLPRRDRLERVARALGLPPGELLVRSGWAGADGARPSAPAPEPAPVAALPHAHAHAPSFEPAGWRLPDAAPRSIVHSSRLREMIARAEETRDRSADILRRCEERWGAGGDAGRPA